MGRSRETLTPRQRAILVAIRDYREEHDQAPSMREIGRLAGILPTSVVEFHLNSLAARGLLRRRPRIARGLSLTDAGLAALEAEVAA